MAPPRLKEWLEYNVGSLPRANITDLSVDITNGYVRIFTFNPVEYLNMDLWGLGGINVVKRNTALTGHNGDPGLDRSGI